MYVYVGRGSKWGNPYRVSEYGRKKCVAKYETYIRNSYLMDHIFELKQKVLCCFCAPLLCHSSILVKILNEMS